MRRPKVFYPKAMIKVSGADKLTAQAREASAAAAGRARDATSAAAQTAAQRATQGVQTAQTAAQTAQAAAQTAAQAASAAAQIAAEAAGKSVRKGVFSARGWVAPRLENAADYTTDTVAPKVSSVLRDTARQISPADSRHKGSRPALRWSLLATAAFTAAGAAALLVRQRYRAGMAARTEEAEAPVQPTPATGAELTTPATPAPADRPADTEVNGKVSAPAD
jgi:trimeric autotransporter adhesin